MDNVQAKVYPKLIEKNLVGTDDPRKHGKGLTANDNQATGDIGLGAYRNNS